MDARKLAVTGRVAQISPLQTVHSLKTYFINILLDLRAPKNKVRNVNYHERVPYEGLYNVYGSGWDMQRIKVIEIHFRYSFAIDPI